LQYILFLPAVFLLFWFSPHRWRIPILLGASYVFYVAWRPIYLLLIVGLTVVNYWLGLQIGQSQTHKKAWMIGAVAANLAVLAYFKYFYFLEDILGFLTKPLFGEITRASVNIVLPLGISFFVFEFIHYVVEVYRGKEPVREFMSFALFPAFFPTQIAGPIKRFQDFIPQLKEVKTFSWAEFDEGMYLILQGLFKKVLLADNLEIFVKGGFSNPHLFTSVDMWLFALAFDFQIYFDFSGYADIARGSAKLFGFKVPINFNFPFLSGSIAEFWQQWHITLGVWLRNYLYIPLGMTTSRVKAARNLLITMTLAGLWHGAEFHYVLWGMYQGLLLAIHREFRLYRMKNTWPAFLDSKFGHVFSIFLTFTVTTLGMAIFRAENTPVAGSILKKMFFLDGAGQGLSTLQSVNYPFIFPSIFVLLPLFLIGQAAIYRFQHTVEVGKLPRFLRASYAACLALLILAFSPDNSPRFIYYQF
jgi:alginate O-acetyltransferase complex protein AlgI